MSDKVWSGTKSNPLFVHAFPEGKGICNARIAPRAGHDLMTLDEAKRIQLKVCERCEFRMAHLARKAEAERNPIQTLTPAEAANLADDQGRVIFYGSAKEYKKPGGYTFLVRVESQGRMFALVDADSGTTHKRVRADHPLYVRRVPEGYDAMRAEAERQAEAVAESFVMAEVAAPVAQAERRTEDAPQLDAQADAEGDDVTVSAQDIADAALGACEWTPEQIADAAQAEAAVVEAAEALTKDAAQGARYAVGQTVEYKRASIIPASIPDGPVEVVRVLDHGPEATHRQAGRFTYIVRIPGIAHATQGASEDELSAVEGAPQLDPEEVTRAQAEAAREADAKGAQAEAEAREAARLRLEALRGPEVEAELVHAGTHRNVSYMITMAPNEKARASWQRVAMASWFASQVKAHAQANSANGWDVVIESWDDGEFNVMMLEAAPQSTEEAIAYVRAKVVDPYRERMADALISAWGF